MPVILTWVYAASQKQQARLLIDSIRAFGGVLAQSSIWLFEANPQEASCSEFESMGIEVLSLDVPINIRHYEFGAKVYACLQAEKLAAPGVQSLVWLDPGVLIARPPVLYDLGQDYDAAVRPVHIRNVGLLTTESLDSFWKGVYQAVGVQDIQTSVESFVDCQRIRSYFNSAAFTLNPSKGLFHRWYECFEALVWDQEFQGEACQDERHRIFLHQAVLSALIASMLAPSRIRIVPPEYGYPYNLQPDVPPERRARALNDLVSIVYEDRSIDPSVMGDIAVHEPLRSWLSVHSTTRAD